MHRLLIVTLAATCLLLSGCDNPAPQAQPTSRENRPYLTREYAAMRAEQIEGVRYELSVTLNKDSDQFSGLQRIHFTLVGHSRSDVTVDFNGGTVESVRLNDTPVEWAYNERFITLPAQAVTLGQNLLEIRYTRPYATDGDGLHRYTDPQSGNQYLYTNFEPYNANKLFPHFDQPNIKAQYDLQVTAPADWQVISATRENRVEKLGDEQRWHFPRTPPIPSYIFPLHAGPYHVWEETYSKGDYQVPMRLFARPELADYVVEQDWFTFTRQSFDFFNDYFDLPYMFDKYDQVIVPDFNAGAMENLGAVTFTERFVSRGQKLESQRIRLANVIAHEMAHMWFGNLVTMNWWDGLWLNESFATYMANLQLARASDFENTWDIFYSGTKQWAYETDQQVTTHPIELPVPTTADAFTNFDGITYGKGASVLKQLPHYLGEENFRQGVANYLRKHAYGNTELEDFIKALAEAAGRDLDEWTQNWLHRAGLNSLRPAFHCENGQLRALTLRQSAPEDHPTLRAQRVQVGLFNLDGQQAKITARIPVTYAGEETAVPVPPETPCPDLVYPNLDDWGYVKVELDETSRASLQNNIHAFTDASLRIMLWQALWDSVRDRDWPLTAFVDFAIQQLPAETDDRIFAQVASQLDDSYEYLGLMDPSGTQWADERKSIANLFWQQVNTAEPGSDQQLIGFDSWTGTANGSAHLDRAQALLRGDIEIEGLTLDQDRRWRLVLLLNRFAHGDYRAITQAEAARDSSDRGQRSLLAAQATRADESTKADWLKAITRPDSRYKLAQLRTVMAQLFPASQAKLLNAHADRILEGLPQIADREERFIQLYLRYLTPTTCSEHSVARLADAIEQYADLSPSMNKGLRIAHQEDERCLGMQTLLTQNGG